MTAGGYERYGLTSNPFRNLSSESSDDVELFHVNLRVDDALRTIKDEVFEKENRAVVALVGDLGTGKTERLLVAAREARERKAFVVYFDVPAKTTWVLQGLAEEFEDAARAGGFSGRFSQPRGIRKVGRLRKVKEKKYDAVQAGKAIAAALNDCAPAFLLLNDLHNLAESAEVESFVKTLQEAADTIRPGVLIMFSCYPAYLTTLVKTRGALASRINRTFTIPPLSADEAALLLAKKLLTRRVVEDLDPLYPFDRESVAAMNQAAGGNPRRLLRFADLAMEYGVEHRAYRVDATVVQTLLQSHGVAMSLEDATAPGAATIRAPELGPLAKNGIPTVGKLVDKDSL